MVRRSKRLRPKPRSQLENNFLAYRAKRDVAECIDIVQGLVHVNMTSSCVTRTPMILGEDFVDYDGDLTRMLHSFVDWEVNLVKQNIFIPAAVPLLDPNEYIEAIGIESLSFLDALENLHLP